MSYAESSREVVAMPWRDEEMVVAVAPDTSACRPSTRCLQRRWRGRTLSGSMTICRFRIILSATSARAQGTVEMALHFDNLEMIKEAVAHGAGISIMPERVMREDMEHGEDGGFAAGARRTIPPGANRPQALQGLQ